ncbi:MAG: aminotransferase class III-fold pyridoxal phosphate-dependent enzyme [Gammaproteobacteria bacterium]|nr:aminotransferase class III-fold pyridoxal phosphate-dependent enzyme [Gammaproteobacteria bacterium]
MTDAARDRSAGIGALEQEIHASFRARTPKSAACFARATRSLAGGTTGNLRYFAPYPFYLGSGRGTTVVDLDGNEYLDCFLCNGPLLLGHRHPAVEYAMDAHRETGALVVNPELIVEAAELVCRTVPCAERVRFLNSGTEAVLTAARYARAHTGRNRIIKFRGHYHGQDDQFLVGLGPTDDKFGAGVPDAAVSNTMLVRYGDTEALERSIESNSDIAAVILDPAMHAGGLWGSSREYLQAIRDITLRKGIVLIIDEVITGFRLALGGAQAYYGVTPDLATFGKALAAGEKLAAVAGREEIMRVVDPNAPADVPRVFQSGTGNDGTAALAAAVGAIGAYRSEASAGYARLFDLAKELARGIRAAFAAHEVPCHVNQLGPMLQMFLTDAEPGFEHFSNLDHHALALFYLAMLNEGIILTLPTSNHIYFSFVHSMHDVRRIIEKVNLVLDRYDFASVV